jgi:hypothetical protein
MGEPSRATPHRKAIRLGETDIWARAINAAKLFDFATQGFHGGWAVVQIISKHHGLCPATRDARQHAFVSHGLRQTQRICGGGTLGAIAPDTHAAISGAALGVMQSNPGTQARSSILDSDHAFAVAGGHPLQEFHVRVVEEEEGKGEEKARKAGLLSYDTKWNLAYIP